MPVARSLQLYPPGFVVPESGIYWVVHGEHRKQHVLIALKDEIFPGCRTCEGRVRFYLAQPLHHFADDWDFTGPDLALLEPNSTDKVA